MKKPAPIWIGALVVLIAFCVALICIALAENVQHEQVQEIRSACERHGGVREIDPGFVVCLDGYVGER